MLHEGPGLFDNQYTATPPEQDSFLLSFEGDDILIGAGDALVYPTFSALPDTHLPLTYLFSMDGTACYLAPGTLSLPDFERVPVRKLRFMLPRDRAFLGITAYHLYRWYRAHQFCGVCGTPTVHAADERMLSCPACLHVEYPVLMPAVIVGIISGDKLLLTQLRGRPQHHRALVAGYVEIGETLEDTVRREVYEETGLQVTDITYYKSQPWGFSFSLLVGFFARLQGDETLHPQDDELESAVFVERNAIDIPCDGISLTNEMICRFRKGGAEGLLRPPPPPFVP